MLAGKNTDMVIPCDRQTGIPLIRIVDVCLPKHNCYFELLDKNITTRCEEIILANKQLDILATYNLDAPKKILFIGSQYAGQRTVTETISFNLNLPIIDIPMYNLIADSNNFVENVLEIFKFIQNAKGIVYFSGICNKRYSRNIFFFLQMFEDYKGNNIIIIDCNGKKIPIHMPGLFDKIIGFPNISNEQSKNALEIALRSIKREPNVNAQEIVDYASKLGLHLFSFKIIENIVAAAVTKTIITSQPKVTADILKKEVEEIWYRMQVVNYLPLIEGGVFLQERRDNEKTGM